MQRLTARAIGVLVMCALAACSVDRGDGTPASSDTATGVTSTDRATSTSGSTASSTPADSPTTSSTTETTVAAEPTTPPAPSTTEAPPRPPVAVSGPIEGGAGMATRSIFDLAPLGYTEEEFFIEGDAASFTALATLGTDGKWSVEPAATMPYRTRIIVRRPSADEFSGTVFVEWLNVSGGADANPDWGYTSNEIIRRGHAWVGVSAQAVGVIGGETIMGESPAGQGGLVGADPERYGTLTHPGDMFSFDIYTQAAEALINSVGPSPLADLRPQHVIGMGESQSAFYLTTYINAIQPIDGVFDGFLVHSRGGGAPRPDGGGTLIAPAEDVVSIRDDLDVPVFVFLTETDVTLLSAGHVGQPDSAFVRVWEVAGTAHADAYLLQDVYGIPPTADGSSIINCPLPINSGPQHEVLQAALHHLANWVTRGDEPPVAPRLELASTNPLTLERDELGIAVGGIRSPSVDVPVAVLSGDVVEGASSFCRLFGSTVPFDDATLAELYPTGAAYLEAFDASLREMLDAGFILDADVGRLTVAAEAFAATLES